MTTTDVVVYTHGDGTTYVANFDGEWKRWPARQDGWQEAQGCPATLADSCEELDTRLGGLALKLSGVRDG